MKRLKKWTKEELLFLQENFPKYGSQYCAKHLDRTIQSIQSQCKIYKIYMPRDIKIKNIINRVNQSKKYVINKNMFYNIETPEIAYILGLLWADGSLRDSNSSRITITLIKDDFQDVLDIFNKVGNWSIKERKYSCHKNTVITLQCYDRELHSFLSNLGFMEKSYISAERVIDHIPKHLQHYFWRGYFDGDGCFYSNYSNYKFLVSITSSFEQDWSFANSLKYDIGLDFKISKFSHTKLNKKQYSYSRFIISNTKNILLFLNYIYQGDNLGLKRKYNKYQEFNRYKSGNQTNIFIS